ncbi:M23 family metallopeptidase [Streptomyces sp. YIM S03343]
MTENPRAQSPTADTPAAVPVTPDPPPTTTPAERPRRRGPGPFTLLVLPCLIALPGVAGFLALNGGFPPDWVQGTGQQDSGADSMAESYAPWLRKAADRCSVVTPSLLAAQIDQLSGWKQETSAPSDDEGIAGFSPAGWKTWGKDADSDGHSSPTDPADAVTALGREDCSLAAEVTGLRTDGRINGDLVDLTLAAYATGTDDVTEAGGVPAGARTYVSEVKSLLPRYEAFDRTAAATGAAVPAAPAGAVLTPPLTGGLTVTSPFGTRKHPLTGVTKLHTGADFAGTQGTEVYAAREGRVVFAGLTKAYGNRIVVDHGTIAGKPLQTTYSQLSALQVTVGRSVRAGTLIGLVGSTGLSTGPHLHFEVIYGGACNDPLPWLGIRSSTR